MAQPDLDTEIDPLAPAVAQQLVGHEGAEQALLDAFNSKRLAHAWLISGPRGIGKATLAYRFARFLFEHGVKPTDGLFGDGPAGLDVSSESSAFRLVAQGGHPGLRVIERAWDEKNKRLRSEIVVDDVRALHGFFGMTSGDGGWRVAIIDSADEMNRQAANALLKILEEPPKRAILLLLAHAPGRLLPTIRSRCRHLALRPLEPQNLDRVLDGIHIEVPDEDRAVILGLAAGSPGRALALLEGGGAGLYRQIIDLLASLPRLDAVGLHRLGDAVTGKKAADAFRLLGELLDGTLQRLITYKATGKAGNLSNETALFAKLAPMASLDQWVEVWENAARLFPRAAGLNLDPKQTTITVFSRIQAATA
ncbi:MAG: DNA polymerase III subunit delta' [Alphaproteobacteria bacterium]